MRLIGRIIGVILVLAALMVLVSDILLAAQGGGFSLRPLGQVWFSIDPPSLNLAQAVTERYLAVWLWDSVFFPLLNFPAVLVLGIPGVLLLLACRRRDHRVFSS